MFTMSGISVYSYSKFNDKLNIVVKVSTVWAHNWIETNKIIHFG